ncbi:unnamed protein product [Rotaria sp. Silwood2]|nr:unnamed protein product [Rotaria sp. Silwood2]
MDAFLSQPTSHSHAPQPDRIPAIQLQNEIKARAATTDESTSSILHSSLRTYPLSAAGALPKNDTLMLTIRRQRIVETVDADGHLPENLKKTYRGEDFTLHEDEHLIIFTTKTNLSILKQKTYLQRTGRKKPLFDHKLWNIHDRVAAAVPRSNNSVEGWHNAFANRVSISHLTVIKLTEKIRREQSKFEVDIAKILQGHDIKTKKACYRRLDERITRLVNAYDSSQLDQFLTNMAANITL